VNSIEELCKLIDEAGLKVTFDPFRDMTKGCGSHCRAWERSDSESYCENHRAAIERGEYQDAAKGEKR
jgi:hypothetical protein